MRALKVLSVASEVFPLVKTGGLADVVGALPAALKRERVTVRTLVPGYPAVVGALSRPRTAMRLDLFGGQARLLAGKAAGLDLIALDAPHLFARQGNPYQGPDGLDWPDNLQRFAALSRAAALIGGGAVPPFVPDVVHAHDWQAGLSAAYLYYQVSGRRPGSIVTIHNIAFQGAFAAHRFGMLGLPAEAFATEGIEYYGQLSFLKAGLHYADRITTVSPQYAAEIRTPQSGMGLEGLLRARSGAVHGILNGLDDEVWDPSHDTSLAATFDAASPERRAPNKAALQARFGLPDNPETLLFGVVSRLSWQKGIDLLLAALPTLLGQGAQLVVLGAGDRAMEDGLRAARGAYPDRVGVVFGYDEALAHLIQGGADSLLVPSRFEPCGLTQLAALRYGAVPLVARVGGLADTVVDAGEMAVAAGVATGIQFSPVDSDAFIAAIEKTGRLWRDRPTWRRMQLNGMATEVGWRLPARHYAALYREVAADARARAESNRPG